LSVLPEPAFSIEDGLFTYSKMIDTNKQARLADIQAQVEAGTLRIYWRSEEEQRLDPPRRRPKKRPREYVTP
jgi:hypothetical protein